VRGAAALTGGRACGAQEQHAMLVVQSTREINELRYVLCPKRMSDATFWQIYFALARKRLPDAAFEPAPAAARAAPADAMSLADLQVSALSALRPEGAGMLCAWDRGCEVPLPASPLHTTYF
jgi:hypothetical protein